MGSLGLVFASLNSTAVGVVAIMLVLWCVLNGHVKRKRLRSLPANTSGGKRLTYRIREKVLVALFCLFVALTIGWLWRQ